MTFVATVLAALVGAILGVLLFGSPLGRKAEARRVASRMVEEELTLRQIKQRQAARAARALTPEEIDALREVNHEYVTKNLSDRALADYVNGILRTGGVKRS